MLERDLDDADEQYQVAFRRHLQNLDQLIQLQVCNAIACRQGILYPPIFEPALSVAAALIEPAILQVQTTWCSAHSTLAVNRCVLTDVHVCSSCRLQTERLANLQTEVESDVSVLTEEFGRERAEVETMVRGRDS